MTLYESRWINESVLVCAVSVTACRERGKHAPLQQVRGPVTCPLNLAELKPLLSHWAPTLPTTRTRQITVVLFLFAGSDQRSPASSWHSLTEAVLERQRTHKSFYGGLWDATKHFLKCSHWGYHSRSPLILDLVLFGFQPVWNVALCPRDKCAMCVIWRGSCGRCPVGKRLGGLICNWSPFSERNGLGMKTKHGYNLGNIYYPSSQSHCLHFR